MFASFSLGAGRYKGIQRSRLRCREFFVFYFNNRLWNKIVGRAVKKLLPAVEDSHERCERQQLTLAQASHLSPRWSSFVLSYFSIRLFNVRIRLSAALGMKSAHVHEILCE